MLVTAGKGFAILSALKPTPWHLHIARSDRSTAVICDLATLGRLLSAAISNNLLLVKTSTDYIITKLLDSTHVKFSQLELSHLEPFYLYEI